MSSPQHVRVRLPPSPTGFLHIGNLRTALYNELFARRHHGDFILRIEDTDQKRFIEGGIETICHSLERCGLVPNEGLWLDQDGKIIERGAHGPYLQTQRKDKHLAYAQQLIEMDKAYYCFCSEERLTALRETQTANHQPTMYDGQCRNLSAEDVKQKLQEGLSHVIRMKAPKDGETTFKDIIRGEVTIAWSQIDDQVLVKSDGLPTYHLANTCDDHDMEITHVIRGEEWISSVPKHIFIYKAFGWDIPVFAHLPLLLNSDRSKLSKRQGDVAVEDYLNKGYLPEALVNFVALCGWNPKADQEIYTHKELISLFDLEKVNKAGAVVNFEKLDWMNVQYIKMMSEEKYLEMAKSVTPVETGVHPDGSRVVARDDRMNRLLLLIRDRVVRLTDIPDLVTPYLKDHLDYSSVSLIWKTQSSSDAVERLEAIKEVVSTLSEDETLQRDMVEQRMKQLILDRGWGNGDTLWPLRVALSGQEKSPGPFDLVAAYGKEIALKRIEDALEYLKS